VKLNPIPGQSLMRGMKGKLKTLVALSLHLFKTLTDFQVPF
jgi:hypothetical protein